MLNNERTPFTAPPTFERTPATFTAPPTFIDLHGSTPRPGLSSRRDSPREPHKFDPHHLIVSQLSGGRDIGRDLTEDLTEIARHRLSPAEIMRLRDNLTRLLEGAAIARGVAVPNRPPDRPAAKRGGRPQPAESSPRVGEGEAGVMHARGMGLHSPGKGPLAASPVSNGRLDLDRLLEGSMLEPLGLALPALRQPKRSSQEMRSPPVGVAAVGVGAARGADPLKDAASRGATAGSVLGPSLSRNSRRGHT